MRLDEGNEEYYFKLNDGMKKRQHRMMAMHKVGWGIFIIMEMVLLKIMLRLESGI